MKDLLLSLEPPIVQWIVNPLGSGMIWIWGTIVFRIEKKERWNLYRDGRYVGVYDSPVEAGNSVSESLDPSCQPLLDAYANGQMGMDVPELEKKSPSYQQGRMSA